MLCDQNYQFEELAELRARGVSDDRPLRLGALHRRARRRRARGLRRRLLDHRGRAGALPRDGASRRPASRGASTPSCSRSASRRRGRRPTRRSVVASSSPAGSSATASRSSRSSRRSTRPTDPRAAAARQGAGRAHAARRAAAAAVERDPRIELRLADEPTGPSTCATIAACDVCISPSRWEGLGLPLYEAIAFGMPAITNDDPPMNEVIRDGVNGLLVALARRRRRRARGSRRCDPDVDDAARGDRAARRRRAARRARRRRGARARHRARAGARPWRGSASCWKSRRTGSLEGFMGSPNRSTNTASGSAIMLRRAAPARAHARAAAGAVRLRRDALGHDAAAADARLAPRPRDPGRDPLGAEADQGLRALEADRRGRGRPGDRPQALGRLPPRRRRAARADRRPRPGDRRRLDPRPST